MGDGLCWTIDASAFGGRPQLNHAERDGAFCFSLSDATYPGTDVPADLTARVLHGDGAGRLQLEMKLGGFSCDVDLERWLRGDLPARSRTDLPDILRIAGDDCAILSKGAGILEYRPDSSLVFHGESPVCVRLDGVDLPAECVRFGLLPRDAVGAFGRPYTRRAFFGVERGPFTWHVEPHAVAASTWRVAIEPDAYHGLFIETDENPSGDRRHALIFTAAEACASVAPDGEGKRGFHLPLRSVRYLLAMEKAGRQSVVTSGFGETWLSAGNIAVLVGGPDGSQPFLSEMRGGQRGRVICEPALRDVRVSLEYAALTRNDGQPPGSIRVLTDVEAPPERGSCMRLDANGEIAMLRISTDKAPGNKPPKPPDYDLLRTDDLLRLHYTFTHLDIVYERGKPPVLRTDGSQSYVSVTFPPQHIAEQAYFETDQNLPARGEPQRSATSDQETPGPRPIPAVIAGQSTLVFKFPPNLKEIPFTEAGLLGWAAMMQSVPPGAGVLGDNQHGVRDDASPVTAIEYPVGLILSPNSQTAWAHSVEPVAHMRSVDSRREGHPGGERPAGSHEPQEIRWVELWHTRMAVRNQDGSVDEDNALYRILRATGNLYNGGHRPGDNECDPNYRAYGDATPPFRTSLDASDRNDLVTLTYGSGQSASTPVAAKRFILTGLGAWADLHGSWDSTSISLRDWRQIGSAGRDHYVRTVYGGFLYPFGHRASLTQITERKFQSFDNGEVTAYLRQRLFITIEQPTNQYGDCGIPCIDNRSPFVDITVSSLVTPNLDDPADSAVRPASPRCAFWPRVGGTDYPFQLSARDHAQPPAHIGFAAPCIFVSIAASTQADFMKEVQRAYRDADRSRYKISMSGQSVAFARPNLPNVCPPRKPGGTSFNTDAIQFSAFAPAVDDVDPGNCAIHFKDNLETVCPGSSWPNGHPEAKPPAHPATQRAADPLTPVSPWYLVADQSWVEITAVTQTTQQASGPPFVPFRYFSGYLNNGFDTNFAGEVFGEFVDGNHPFQLPPITATGIGQPDLSFSGLSRLFGAVGGDLGQLHAGSLQFDANGFHLFGDSAKLFGIIDIIQLIETSVNFSKVLGNSVHIPYTTTTVIYADKTIATQIVKVPVGVESKFEWHPPLKEMEAAGLKFLPISRKGVKAAGELSVDVISRYDQKTTTIDVVGEITNFQIEFFGAVLVSFDKLRYETKTGQKQSVVTKLTPFPDGIVFEGALNLIADLENILPSGLFGDSGPSLSLTAQGIDAHIGLSLPDIGCGVFVLQNINLFSDLTIPLGASKPLSLSFAFGTRDNPFQVSVSFLGGGGFLGFSLNLNGLESFEAAMDFGAIAELDLLLATAEAEIVAGVDFKYVAGTCAAGDPDVGVSVTGYLEAYGSVSVLDLITVSVEFYLGLTYDVSSNVLSGSCTVTVNIHLLFVSKSISLTLERDFIGSSKHPECGQTLRPAIAQAAGVAPAAPAVTAAQPHSRFTDLMDEYNWEAYCGCFAGLP
jgi:hypothetical protein